MDKPKGLKGFLVVLPGEIIEILQDSDKSWLTLFYSLPRELAEKWKPAYELPRCPYEVLRTDKYDNIVCDDMFKLLVWDCYAWCAWQFFQVKDRKGNYRDIPGNWNQYAGYFPLWRLSYSIIPYIRMKFEQNGLGFQNLYNIPQGVEVPWLTYQQFSNLVGNVTDMVIAEQNWQPMIDAIWENRTVEDYETTSSTVKTDFMRKWHHNRSGKPISLDEMMENEDGDIFEVADPRGEFEQEWLEAAHIKPFKYNGEDTIANGFAMRTDIHTLFVISAYLRLVWLNCLQGLDWTMVLLFHRELSFPTLQTETLSDGVGKITTVYNLEYRRNKDNVACIQKNRKRRHLYTGF